MAIFLVAIGAWSWGMYRLGKGNKIQKSAIFLNLKGTTNGNEFMRKQELIDAAEASGLSRVPIGYVHTRVENLALGKLSLNLTGFSKESVSLFGHRLSLAVKDLLPVTHCIPLTVEYLNSSSLVPIKDYETNRLIGVLQLAEGSHLIVNETQLKAGTLNPVGMDNTWLLKNLIELQKQGKDFSHWTMHGPSIKGPFALLVTLALYKLSFPFEIQPSWDYMDVFWLLQKWEEARPGLLEKTVMICWGIWKNRNEARHGGKQRSGLAVTRSSLGLLEEFQLANERPNTTAEQNQLVKWDPPPSGCYKVNIDGAVFSKRKQAGVGVVIRDEAGQVVATLSRKLHAPLGPLESEAKAMEVGVKFAMEIGVQDVLFEGDSLVLNNAIHGLNEVAPSVQNVVKGILQSVQGFRTFSFSHTKRDGNAPAHALAQYAVYVEDFLVWLEECPHCIMHACMQDVRSISSSD